MTETAEKYTTYNEVTREETWTRILFGDGEMNDPFSCFEVGYRGCTKIEGKFHGKDDGGLDMYSYIVHFKDGNKREITNTRSVC